MMWIVRLLFTVQPQFRPCDGCHASDLDLVRQMADLLEARDAINQKAFMDCTGLYHCPVIDGSVRREGSAC
jgi:coenzyme F420-reducing hydrogenase gamma subunit